MAKHKNAKKEKRNKIVKDEVKEVVASDRKAAAAKRKLQMPKKPKPAPAKRGRGGGRGRGRGRGGGKTRASSIDAPKL